MPFTGRGSAFTFWGVAEEGKLAATAGRSGHQQAAAPSGTCKCEGCLCSHVKLFIHSYFWPEKTFFQNVPCLISSPHPGTSFQLLQASQHLATGTSQGHNSSSLFISFHFSSPLGRQPAEMFFAKIIVST